MSGYIAAAAIGILALALTGGWARDRWLDWRYRAIRARLDADLPTVVVIDNERLLAERLVYDIEAWLREETAP